MTDRRLSPRHFDNARDLVAKRAMTLNGIELNAGDPIPASAPEGVEPGPEHSPYQLRLKLWMSARACYADDYVATPVTPADEPLGSVVVPLYSEDQIEESTDKGVTTITAPWLEAPVKAKGKAAAEQARAAVLEAMPVAPEPEGGPDGDGGNSGDQQGGNSESEGA